jgi:hypothetical protein
MSKSEELRKAREAKKAAMRQRCTEIRARGDTLEAEIAVLASPEPQA